MKYLRADGTWAEADAEHKFLRGDGTWAVPDIGAGVPADQESFAALSWAEIAELSATCAQTDGAAYKKLLGFTKDVEVSGVGTVKAKLIGINHDNLSSGGKAGFTFQLTDGLSYSKPVNMRMNNTNSTSGGWNSCEMRTTNLPKLQDALPSDLKGLLKYIVKKTNMTNSGSTLTKTTDKLALLSYTEVFGDDQAPNNSNTTWCKNEGTRYEWYAEHDTNSDRTIKQDSGTSYNWWLRSVYNSNYFGLVTNKGEWNDYHASRSYLPAACFCV